MSGFFPGAPLPGSTFMTDLQNLLGDMAGQISPSNFRNIVGRNGGLEIWQRGPTVGVAATATAYTADGWYLAAGSAQASTITRIAGLTNNSQFAAQVQRNAAQTGTGQMYFAIPLDLGDDIYKLRGQHVIVSFVLSTGANWSPTSGAITCNLYLGTGAAAKRGGTPYTSETNPLSFTNNVAAGTGALQYTSGIVACAANVTQAELQFTWTPTGTAGVNDWFAIDDVQLEVVSSNLIASGGFVPMFERTGFMLDYRRCLKHYRKSFPYATAPAQNQGQAGALGVIVPTASATCGLWVAYDDEMRASPTLTFFNPSNTNGNWRDVSAVADSGVPGTFFASAKGVFIFDPAAGAAGDLVALHYSADASI